MHPTLSNSITSRLFAVILTGAGLLGGLGGCDNAGQGAVTGAGVGALSGLAIGSMSGNAGRGAATGAIVGGVGGAAIGDNNRRQAQRAAPVPVAGPTPDGGWQQAGGLSNSDRDRLALARFARAWRVTGWETVNGQRRFVSGNAFGSIDSTFFVRLDVTITDELSGRINTGNVVFASEPGRGLTMNSRFDSSPTPITYAGTISDDGNLITLSELAPGFGPTGRGMVIRFISPDQWVADESDRSGGQATPIGALTFTATR